MNELFQRLSSTGSVGPKPPPQTQNQEREHHQPLDPSQGLRRIHAPPLLLQNQISRGRGGANEKDDDVAAAPTMKLRLLPNAAGRHPGVGAKEDEEPSVTELRRLYSSLLEEMAPIHHGSGTASSSSGGGGTDKARANNASYRWKNSGTVTVNGSDDEGYDYSYAPDDSRRSWRVRPDGGAGVTGGDWSKDGIRRYYTGGTLFKGGGGGHSSNIISVGGMSVDVGTMNGVELSPPKKGRTLGDAVAEFDVVGQFSIDDSEEAEEEVAFGCEQETLQPILTEDSREEADMEDVLLDVEEGETKDPTMTDPARSGENETGDVPWNPFDRPENDATLTSASQGGNRDGSISFSPTSADFMTAFESLYHLSPAMAWRLRSAHAPCDTQERHLLDHGSEMMAQRAGGAKADGILAGLEVARDCEARVCQGLARMGRLISRCEARKGAALEARREEEELVEANDDDDDELDAAEAVFAYFCEKNVLPMLIDSLLCRPPPLASSDGGDGGATLPSNSTTIGSAPSPFTGVCWTSPVKAQILSTIAMILFNTSSPLSLTYLLSNNYMNELIMGMLPLDRWKADALEEMLPPYVTLLRGLAMRLRGEEGRCCLPLFLCRRPRRRRGGARRGGGKAARNEEDARARDDDHDTETYLPLLYAAVQVFCSPLGTSLRDSEGCLVRTTAMNVVLNLCRIADPEVRAVLVWGGLGDDDEDSGRAGDRGSLPTTRSAPSSAAPPAMLSHPLTIEQEMLFPHVCNSLNSWFHRSVRLAMASLSVDGKRDKSGHLHEAKAEARARHEDMARLQFRELQYWLGFLDDLLSCEIRAWNARLVEWIMREVVVGTVLLRWNRAVEVIGSARGCGERSRVSAADTCRARAEVRVAMVFLTQLFGMVEYSPLIRLVGAVLLHQNYPRAWCGTENEGAIVFEKEDGFFVVTPAVNAMVSMKSDDSAGGAPVADADAGAGGGPKNASGGGAQDDEDRMHGQDSNEKEVSPGKIRKSPSPSGRTSPSVNEMEHRALETVAKVGDFQKLAEEVEHSFSEEQSQQYTPSKSRADQQHAPTQQRVPNQQYTLNKQNADQQHPRKRQQKHNPKYTSNKQRAALLDMLAGADEHGYSPDETVLASMLLATILENDAIDDIALELFAVLPSPKDSIQLSPFETSIAQYLSHDVVLKPLMCKAMECVSSLGMMLLERTVFHTWTEGGQCVDVVPFDHYYKSSKFIQALGMSLSCFASQAQAYLPDAHATREIFSNLIRQRYSHVEALDSPRSNDEMVGMICSLQSYYPSNWIDDACVLTGKLVRDGTSTSTGSSSSGDLALACNENDPAKFAIQLTLHLRSLLACVQDLYTRHTSQHDSPSIANSRWHGEGGPLSFFTMEEADDLLLSIAGFETNRLPVVGTNIDLRGRKFFCCTLPRKSKFGRSASDIIIDEKGTRVVVTEKTELVLVIDPMEIYVAKLMDGNRSTVLVVIPLRDFIASAMEGEILHIVCNAKEKTTGPLESMNILRNGTLSLRFEKSVGKSTKECLEKHHQAYESKIVMDMTDMLEKCSLMGSDTLETSQSNEMDDNWCDFQHA